MRLVAVVAVAALCLLAPLGTASADIGHGGTVDRGSVSVGIKVTAPGSGSPGHPHDDGDAHRPLLTYVVLAWVNPTPLEFGNLDGLCAAPGGTADQPRFGFLYHLLGSDQAGTIVDDHFECVPFAGTDLTVRPDAPPVPAVPTVGEAWDAATIPAPAVRLDPSSRGITGLDTRISTAGPSTVAVAATVRGYTITGTATLDHYEISVDSGAPTDAGSGHFTFDTLGDHTIAVSAVWHGTAVISGPGLALGSRSIDLGTAAITSTRLYPVDEVRSVLQP